MARAMNARRRRGTRAATMKDSARKQRRMIQRTSGGMCEDVWRFWYLFLLALFVFVICSWRLKFNRKIPRITSNYVCLRLLFQGVTKWTVRFKWSGSPFMCCVDNNRKISWIATNHQYIETETRRCLFLQDLSTHWNPMHPNTSWWSQEIHSQQVIECLEGNEPMSLLTTHYQNYFHQK